MPALVGGGLHARPGEISLAHHGVLFLDELPEFQPQALDSLRVARPDGSGLTLLREAADAMRLSARGYHRVLRVARTLADLDGDDKVGRVHLAEALSYRALADEIRRAA